MHVSFIHIPTIPRSPPAKDVTSLTFFNQHFITKIISLYETLFKLSIITLLHPNSKRPIRAGHLVSGGSGNYSKIQNDNNTSGSVLHLNPKIGYFISDKLVTGVQTTYSHQTNRYANNGLNDNFLIVRPYIRYYLF